MSHSYQAIQWNRQKRIYDTVLGAAVLAFVALFYITTKWRHPAATDEIVLMRAVSIAAFLLLHFILAIGPACRLQPQLLPLLYNRRHAGVTLAVLAWIHSILALATYHAGGNVPPWISLGISERSHGGIASIPFQPFGFAALMILSVMAATSHDFWLRHLTAPVWKALHMLVYVAYALLVLHVSLGILQAESNPLLLGLTLFGVVSISTLHVLASLREKTRDQNPSTTQEQGLQGHTSMHGDSTPEEGYLYACKVSDIPNERARVILFSGERIALFRHEDRIHAVSNVCQHQNGPLGEGRIHKGCITCPWHGYQYLPETGASPPPFTEKIPTFNVQVENGEVWVHPKPNAPGTKARPGWIQPTKHPSTPS